MAPVDTPQIISLTTILSLSAVVGILLTAYILSTTFLPKQSTTKTRIFFIWHAFDALIHFLLEGSFLYNCFFTYIDRPANPYLVTPPDIHFLSQPSRIYGSFYGDGLTAKLWQEYAKADKRWGGADLTVISLELLTVGVMAPLAVYVCSLLSRQQYSKAYFWMTFIATGELYGGFMTFAPEWLTGNPNLDGSNWMYLYLYLSFMNLLWVFIPAWILWEVYVAFTAREVDVGLVVGGKGKGKGRKAA